MAILRGPKHGFGFPNPKMGVVGRSLKTVGEWGVGVLEMCSYAVAVPKASCLLTLSVSPNPCPNPSTQPGPTVTLATAIWLDPTYHGAEHCCLEESLVA